MSNGNLFKIFWLAADCKHAHIARCAKDSLYKHGWEYRSLERLDDIGYIIDLNKDGA
jgi:hypothetical protein